MQVAESVKPERILKDLAKLWTDLAKDDGQPGSSGVLRACAMTLNVLTPMEPVEPKIVTRRARIGDRSGSSKFFRWAASAFMDALQTADQV